MIILHTILLQFVNFFKFVEKTIFTIFFSHTESEVKKVYAGFGVEINGKNPWDIQVKDKSFYTRVASGHNLGLGETYMEGLWTCDDLEELSFRTLRNNGHKEFFTWMNRILNYIMFNIFNLQTKSRAWEVGQKHYDIGNDLFESFLDSSMNYSCGYWRNAKNLEEAQQHKMELIAQKLKLKPGMKVLDIGCGWGGLCKYLAINHGVSCVGITISKEGAKIARERTSNLPVDIRLMDYRDLDEKFDRIVSVGMFEHVGEKNYRTFFEETNKCLVDDGLLLLHTIGVGHKDFPLTEPWTDKYIFPNGVLPYVRHIPKYAEGLYILEDWQNFGNDYSKTLIAWHDNFLKAWPKLSQTRSDKFFRMWSYYLQIASGGFRSRRFQLWQVVLSKDGVLGGYESVR